REALAVAGVVEEVARPATLGAGRGLDPDEPKAHHVGVERVRRVGVPGRDRHVVKAHRCPSRRRPGRGSRVVGSVPWHAGGARAGRTRMAELRENDVDADAVTQFRRWYDDAAAAGVEDYDAMVVATASADGVPSARVVLLRGFDEAGF